MLEGGAHAPGAVMTAAWENVDGKLQPGGGRRRCEQRSPADRVLEHKFRGAD